MFFFLRLIFFLALIVITTIAFLPNYDDLPQIASFSDLLNHAFAFFVLYLLLDIAYLQVNTKYKIAFLLFYAFFIEAVQYFLPTRCADFLDILADSVGIIFALIALKAVHASKR